VGRFIGHGWCNLKVNFGGKNAETMRDEWEMDVVAM
jgi:hypothetical protein